MLPVSCGPGTGWLTALQPAPGPWQAVEELQNGIDYVYRVTSCLNRDRAESKKPKPRRASSASADADLDAKYSAAMATALEWAATKKRARGPDFYRLTLTEGQ